MSDPSPGPDHLLTRDPAADDAGPDAGLLEFVPDRRGTNSMKWDGGALLLTPEQRAADPLPMWVADMDLAAPRVVRDALRDAVEDGVLGYPAGTSPGMLRAVVDWQRRRFGWDVDPAWVVATDGIVATLKTVVQAFTSPGDSVLVQPPVYGHFHDDVRLNGRHLALAPLERVEDGYRFDPVVFEAAIRPDTRLFILSHPHNPTGDVWTEDELRTMGEICARHDVLVVSDEIHQDLVTDPSRRHVPLASLAPDLAARSITCTSPSKTFNLPGLQCAAVVVPDRRVREQLVRQLDRNVFPVPNVLAMVATEAAYDHGEPWLDALLAHLRANHDLFARSVHAVTDRVRVLPAASLYLAWVDARPFAADLGLDGAGLHDWALTRAHLWPDDGRKFGAEGEGYLRFNLGCPTSTVEEAVRRLAAAL